MNRIEDIKLLYILAILPSCFFFLIRLNHLGTLSFTTFKKPKKLVYVFLRKFIAIKF